MEPVGGDLAAHDHEFDEVRWITFESAGSMLTFETERALVMRAGELLAGRPAPSGSTASASKPAGTAP